MTLYKINPGKYRHIITIQEKGTARDSYGRTIDTWSDITKVRAGIFPVSGRDVFMRDFTESEITHRVHIRYDPTIVINSQMRILFGSRVFAITSPPINFQEMNVEWQLMCKEVDEWRT
jgi:SPP1 family predicted phage head-tail adaptor